MSTMCLSFDSAEAKVCRTLVGRQDNGKGAVLVPASTLDALQAGCGLFLRPVCWGEGAVEAASTQDSTRLFARLSLV